MLTVYRSNRAEWLASVLSEEVRLTPPEPFETLEVIVNTWPNGRWLGEELAKVNGISALIRFPFPGTRLRQLVKLILGFNEHDEDPWESTRLVWKILDVLPDLLRTDEATPLREWLNQHPSKKGYLKKEKWELAKSIADAFDDYALYRNDEITQWIREAGKGSETPKANGLQGNWQATLMRLLANEIETEPFGLQVNRAIQKLKSGTPPAKELPRQLHIFGLSSLAPVQIELIQALSGIINIKLFLLTPCLDLWKRCEIRREKLGKSWNIPPDGTWFLQSPRLEASLGRMGAEFQQLLEGSGDSQLGEWQEGDLFAAPVNIATQLGKTPTLLDQLQQQLITSDTQTQLERTSDDTSLIFLSSPGHWRQVQLVRDQILQWFSEDPTLEARDVLIMTPQVNRFAPFIVSAFNDVGATGIQLPCRITDRSQQDNAGLTQYMLEFIALANSRLTATSLDSLFSNPAIQKQKGLSQEDVSKINDQLQLTGFRWGLDAEERGGDEVHSLTWCLDRWLLGLIMPLEPGLAPGGVAPFSQGITLNELSHWWDLLSTFCNQLKELRQPRTCSNWVKLLRKFLENLFNEGGQWEWELKSFISALEDWKSIAGNCQLKIESQVVADILDKSLSLQAGRFGHRSGLITVSALEPMRAIPHRIIVLMGLDENIFPRRKDRPGFHLFTKKRKLGDPSSSDQDRYALLEALMSTRQHLMISWNSRDERTGEALPPSSPVQQILEQIKSQLGEKNWVGLLREPHPNPLDSTNFLPVNGCLPISCDRRNLGARLYINKALKQRFLSLALPLKWDPPKASNDTNIKDDVLKQWLVAPQRAWLEQLQLQPREWITTLEDLEQFELSELQRHRLLKERFEESILEPITTDIYNAQKVQKDENWQSRLAGQGILPPTSAALIECELLEDRWEHLKALLKKFGQLEKKRTLFDGSSEEILWAGDLVVLVELGKLKYKNAIEGWLRHLQICASHPYPISTVIVARKSAKAKQNQYEIALQWQKIPSNAAKEELKKLKHIAFYGLQNCWPVPPDSGWEMAKGNRKSSLKGAKAFQQKWEGGFSSRGENKALEMQLCFGIDCDASSFLNNDQFHNAFSDLYDPLIQNLND